MELFVTDQNTLEKDGWRPGSYEIDGNQEEGLKIRKTAEQYIETLLEFNPDATEQLDLRDKHLSNMDRLGEKASKGSLQLAEEIQHHFAVIEKQLEQGSWLSGNFTDTEKLSTDLSPSSESMGSGMISRFLSTFLFFRPSPKKDFLIKLGTRQKDVVQLEDSLYKISEVLEKDIEIFKNQIKNLGEFCTSLGRNAYLGQAIQEELGRALSHSIFPDDPRRDFIETEYIPRVKKRVSSMRHMLQLNRNYATALTVALMNTETLNKAVLRLREIIISAFNTGVILAKRNYSIDMETISLEEGRDPFQEQDTQSLNISAVTEAFSSSKELSISMINFMSESLNALNSLSYEIPLLKKNIEELFNESIQDDTSTSG